jgi:hypothetical protein
MPDEEPDWTNPRGAMPVAAMGVELRLVDRNQDYPMLARWWEGHGWNAVPARRLPELGVIARVKGEPTAAGWCLMENSGTGVAMIEWLVTSPDATARASAVALKAVVEWLVWRAGEHDLRFDFFLSTCRQEGLAKLLCRCGFQITDIGVIHLCTC